MLEFNTGAIIVTGRWFIPSPHSTAWSLLCACIMLCNPSLGMTLDELRHFQACLKQLCRVHICMSAALLENGVKTDRTMLGSERLRISLPDEFYACRATSNRASSLFPHVPPSITHYYGMQSCLTQPSSSHASLVGQT